MSKFKLKFKLQGLELEVEGSREDVPMITNAIGQQFANMLQPTTQIIDGEAEVVSSSQPVAINAPKKRKRPSKSTSSNGQQVSTKESISITWKHDSVKYSSPIQEWKTVQKALWILYVVSEECHTDELSAPAIADIFNREFKRAGTIRGTNISRDFGKLKLGKDALVGETVGSPSTWFLTEKGKSEVLNLIQNPNQDKG